MFLVTYFTVHICNSRFFISHNLPKKLTRWTNINPESHHSISNTKRLSNLVVLLMMVKNVLHIDNASKKKETGMYKGKINSKFRTKNYTALLLKPCNIKSSLYACKVNILWDGSRRKLSFVIQDVVTKSAKFPKCTLSNKTNIVQYFHWSITAGGFVDNFHRFKHALCQQCSRSVIFWWYQSVLQVDYVPHLKCKWTCKQRDQRKNLFRCISIFQMNFLYIIFNNWTSLLFLVITSNNLF